MLPSERWELVLKLSWWPFFAAIVIEMGVFTWLI